MSGTLCAVATYAVSEAPRGLLGAARAQVGVVTRRGRVGVRLAMMWRGLRPFLGSVAGLACFVTAAFMWHLLAGIVVLGVSFLLIDWYAGTIQRRR